MYEPNRAVYSPCLVSSSSPLVSWWPRPAAWLSLARCSWRQSLCCPGPGDTTRSRTCPPPRWAGRGWDLSCGDNPSPCCHDYSQLSGCETRTSCSMFLMSWQWYIFNIKELLFTCVRSQWRHVVCPRVARMITSGWCSRKLRRNTEEEWSLTVIDIVQISPSDISWKVCSNWSRLHNDTLNI